MFDGLWAFLNDAANREVLGWIGGGIVAIAGGVWTIFIFFAKKGRSGSPPSVTARDGSVSIGRDNIKSPIGNNKRDPGGR